MGEKPRRRVISDWGDGGEGLVIPASLKNRIDIAPAVRHAFQTGRLQELLEQLQALAKKKEVEIEELCKSHYEEFIRAVDELRRVLVDADDLKAELTSGNIVLQDVGSASLLKIERLLESNSIKKNITEAMQMSKNTVRLLELCQKCNNYISQGRFYHALKVIGCVEDQFLRIIPVKKLKLVMEKKIPQMKEHIEKTVRSEFNEWLVQIRSIAKEIGHSAIRRSRQKEVEMSAYMISTPIEEEDEEEPRRIDLTPLHRAYHIHSCLGLEEKFREYYYKNRLLQLNSDIQISSSQQPFQDHYQTFFAQIAGYFVVEDTVLRTAGGILVLNQVETMWETAILRMTSLLEEQFTRIDSATDLLAIKQYVALFGFTINKYGYQVSPLLDCINESREKYHNLLLQDSKRRIRDVVFNDNYEQMIFKKEAEYATNVISFRLQTSELSPAFPYIASFSSTVPEVCRIVTNFINRSADYISQIGDVESYGFVKKYLERLLIDVLNEVILGKIHSEGTGVSQAMQIAANISFLERACDFFLQTAAERCGFSFRSSQRFTPKVVLKTSRDAAYIALLDLVNSKMDEFMALPESIGWTSDEPPEKEHDFANEIVIYLDTLISTAMQTLPPDAIYKVASGALEHISNSIAGAFLTDSVKRFNANAVTGIDLDLKLFESFAEEKFYSSGLSEICRDGSLRDCLIEARQLINLLLSSQAENFMNPVIRQRNYYCLDYKRVACVCDKFKDSSDGLFGSLSSRTSKHTARKKSMDLLKKRLRDFN